LRIYNKQTNENKCDTEKHKGLNKVIKKTKVRHMLKTYIIQHTWQHLRGQ